MSSPASSTAELYDHLQAALNEAMSAAGWVVNPTEPLGPGQTMVAAFQRQVSAEVWVAGFFDRPFMFVSGTLDPGRMTVGAWLGVLYEPAVRLWPLVFEEPPTPLLAIEAGQRDAPPHADPVLVTGLDDIPRAVRALTGPVLRHGLTYAEGFTSIEALVDALRADEGWGSQFLPVVLAAAGRSDDARAALDELGPRGPTGEDRLDREAAGRLRRWIDEGVPLPDALTAPLPPRGPHFPCDDDNHSGCPHVQYMTAIQVLPIGAGMERVGLVEPNFSLCPCRCHAECALAGRADGAGWPEGCSCNETLRMRARSRKLPPGDNGLTLSAAFGRGLDQARRTRSARREAATRAKGRSTEGIEAIIDEVWSRHRLDRLTGMEREAEVSRIANPPNAIEQTVTTAKFFGDLIGAPSRFLTQLRSATSDGTGNDMEGRPYEVATGQVHVEVPIDERTRSRLESVADEGFLAPSLAKLFTVEIRAGRAGTVDVWYQPTANSGAEQLASLSPTDSERFLRPLAAASRVGQRCTSKASCVGDRDGHWRLGIRIPLDPKAGAGTAD